MLRNTLLALALPIAALLQFPGEPPAEPSWLDNVAVEQVEAEQVEAEQVETPEVITAPTLEKVLRDYLEETDIAELRRLAAELAADAERLKKEAEDQRNGVTKMTADWLDDAERIKHLESDFKDLSNGQVDLVKAIEDLRASTCKCDGCVSEDRVRQIVREEIAAQLSIRQADGSLSRRTVTVPASGNTSFQLNPGERLVAIDGVPVSQLSSVASYPSVRAASTPSYVVQASPPAVRSAPVRVQMTRRPSFFGNMFAPQQQYSTCVGGNCR